MRILLLNEIPDPGVGSSTRLGYQLAARYRALGHRVAIVSTVRNPQQATPTEIEGSLVFRLHSDYPLRWRAWVSLHNKAIDGPFRAVLDEFRPDVVHAHLVHTHLGYHSLTQARAAGAAVVFTAHDVMSFCYQKLTCFHGGEAKGGKDWDITARSAKCIPCQRFRFRPGRNARIRGVLERDVHRLTVVSDALGEVLRANRVPVHASVPNGIPWPAALPEDSAVDTFRERFALQGKQVLAIGGRLHSQKGVGKLLEMLALLAPDFPDLRLIVMGKREIYDGEFRAQAEALGIEERVIPTDWLDGHELECAYAAVDVFVTPSICFDTFGLVNLEAMRHGKPVVATSFGGSREVVLDGTTGFIENPFDVPAYAAHIRTLIADPELRLSMGRAGRERLGERFTIDHVASAYLSEYQAALGAKADGEVS